MEPFRHHANDRRDIAIEAYRRADNAGVTVESTLPESVAQYDRPNPLLEVGLAEYPTEPRRDTQRRKQFRGDGLTLDAFRRAVCVSAEIGLVAEGDAERGKRVVPIAPREVVSGERVGQLLRSRLVERFHDHDAIGVGHRQRLTKHRIHDAEHRGVGADPQRE